MNNNHYKYLFWLFLLLNISLLVVMFFSSTNSTNNIQREGKNFIKADLIESKTIRVIGLSKAFKQSQEDKKIKLFLFFPKSYCGMCIDFEMPSIQKIYKKYPQSIVIGNKKETYNLATIISEVSSSKTRIPTITLNNKLLDKVEKPILLLAMEDGTILLSRRSDFFNFKSRNIFYKKVNYILSLVYKH